MRIIDRHISHLLMANDHIVVPGMGVFTIVRNVSGFDGDISTATLTSNINFDYCPSADDDVLVRSVERRERISASQARELVATEVKAVMDAISCGATISFAGVGSLSARANELAFTPASNFTDGRLCSWLAPMKLRPITVCPAEPDAEVDARRAAFARSVSRTASSAAAIAIMIVVAFVASYMPPLRSTDLPEPQMASLSIEPVQVRTGVSDAPVAKTDHALVLILNTPADATADATPNETVPSVASPSDPDRYCLIVASLGTRADAEKYIADNPELAILEIDGRYRVYAATAPSIDSLRAIAIETNLYDAYPSAWICRR